ncbi:hypothetical protein GmHk_15G044060 [Glycine max]|nr:hypothetical protein GmHk_15G044060 [Glycine max]
MIDPTNQHKTFQHVFSSHFSGNFPEGHSSHNYSKSSTLNYELYSPRPAQPLDPSHSSVISQVLLLPRSRIDPTNQHKTFQRVLSSLTRFLGNFPEALPSHNYSKSNTLKCEFILEPHRIRREVCSNTICNIPDFLLLGGFHTTILHAVTFHSTSLLVRTLHRSEPSVGNLFRDLKNQLC